MNKPPRHTRAKQKAKRGPKADTEQTRAAILDAARSEFAERGFEAATLRSIAAAAGVDVALVSYHYGSKPELFLQALQLPVNPAEAVPAVLAAGLDGAGERILRAALAAWDDPVAGAPLAALLRSLPSHADVLRTLVGEQIVPVLAAAIGGPDAELRAAAFTTQALGLVLERYVLRLEPLASASHDEIVATVGPSLQRYLTG